MKAKELKLGDWVYSKDPITCEDTPCQVKMIHPGTVLVDCYRFMLLCEEISPIPLTNEILEKNGWTHYGTQRYWEYQSKYEFTLIHRDGKGFEIEQVPYITFRYVHELQHILWALGMKDNMKI